jgi:hypothetical protein
MMKQWKDVKNDREKFQIVQWKEENKVPDEGKSLMSVNQAKETSRTCKGTQELKLLKTKENEDFKKLVML